MQARTRPLGGQAQQISPKANETIRNIKATIKDAKLDKLGERENEEKLADLLEQAKEVGEQCAEQGIGKTQMMNIVGQLRGLGNTPTIAEIRLLRAHLAYQVAKEEKLEILKRALDPWFDEIYEQWGEIKGKEEDEREDWARKVFGSFVHFVEAIIAFHRYYWEQEERKRKEIRRREGGA